MTTFLKDPDAVLDYSVDWSKWLAGDQIETSTWFVSDPALQPADDSNTTTRATIWLASGAAGQSYTVTNRITTSGGRTDERSLVIQVQDRQSFTSENRDKNGGSGSVAADAIAAPDGNSTADTITAVNASPIIQQQVASLAYGGQYTFYVRAKVVSGTKKVLFAIVDNAY